MSQAVLAPASRNPIGAVAYDVKDLASMLKLNERTIWRLADGGLIPGQIRIGRSVRWSKRVVDQWIERGCPKPKSR